jgi:hypothetical protein
MSKIGPFELAGAAVVVPRYMRGLALLSAQDGTGAVTAFQRTDHPGITRNFVTGSLATSAVGPRLRDERRPGEGTRSIRKFLEFWKNADPEAPILKAARKELAALK